MKQTSLAIILIVVQAILQSVLHDLSTQQNMLGIDPRTVAWLSIVLGSGVGVGVSSLLLALGISIPSPSHVQELADVTAQRDQLVERFLPLPPATVPPAPAPHLGAAREE